MGVEGSGKTTVGRALAARLGWKFSDGDDFHPAANIAKMSAGIPLTDEDRAPWLKALRGEMDRANRDGRNLVLGCSALKQKYRDRLAAPGVQLVYLHGDQALLVSRLQGRTDHFAKANLLSSQLADLEEPRDARVVDVDQSVEQIVNQIVAELKL